MNRDLKHYMYPEGKANTSQKYTTVYIAMHGINF